MRPGAWILLAFVAGLGVGVATGALLGDAWPGGGGLEERGVPVVPSDEVSPGTAPPASASGTAPKDATLEGLGVTDEERTFLHRALTAERERRREAEIRPSDSGLDVLRRRLEHGADLSALVADYEQFAAHVRTADGPTVQVTAEGDVTRVVFDDVPEGTAVLRFGPGTFEVPALDGLRALRGLRDETRTLPAFEIRGAGMDRTTLIGLADWHVAGRIESLVVRDLTWVVSESAHLMLGVSGSVAARIENVRVRGWRTGGYGAAIGASGPCYLALRGCELLGGQRGQNDGGRGISLRDDCVVLAEDCLFADLEHGAFTGWKGNGERAGVWVRNGTFENTRLAAYGGRDEHWLHVHARGGRAAYGPATWTAEERRRWWFQGVGGTVEGVSLEPGIARCTTADLARALARYTAPPDHRVLGIELTAFDRQGPRAFRIYVRGPDPWTGSLRMDVRTDEPGVRRGVDGGTFPNLAPEALDACLSIATLLRRVEVPEGVTVRRFAYGHHVPPEDGVFVPAVPVGWPWEHWIYDARSGDLLEHRSWRH